MIYDGAYKALYALTKFLVGKLLIREHVTVFQLHYTVKITFF